MTPGYPKPLGRVIPIQNPNQSVILEADDAGMVLLEFRQSVSGAKIYLPNDSVVGKSFVFRMVIAGQSYMIPQEETCSIIFNVGRNGPGIPSSFEYQLSWGQELVVWWTPGGWEARNIDVGVYDDGVNSEGFAVGDGAMASGGGVAIGFQAKAHNSSGDLNNIPGVAIGRLANGSTGGAAVGTSANGSTGGAAVGVSANGSSLGAAVGYSANGSSNGVAVGTGADGSSNGTAVGYTADGSASGVAVGRNANGSFSGAAVGYAALGSSSGVAVGTNANGTTNGVAVGYAARSNSKDAAVALGYRSTAQRYREMVKGADKASITLRSFSFLDWYGDTANATPTEILLGGTANQRLTVLANSAFMFSILVVARDNVNNVVSSWKLEGCIKRDASNNTALVGAVTKTVIAQDGGAAAWDIAATADDTNEALALTVTGALATTIRWNAMATISEVRF